MKKVILCLLACVVLLGAALQAQDIVGNWQGILKAEKDLRVILIIAKDNGKLKATMYSIDQGSMALGASAVTLDGATLRYKVDMIGGSYEGKLSADGKVLTGTWSQGATPQAIVLARTTKETAWEIPTPPPPAKLMAADADPSFEVATIKPNNTGATSMQQLTLNGRDFQTRASSLADLIAFSYEVQAKQIVGGPDWIFKDRFDVAGVPDQEGAPNPQQVRTMIRKLLAERFKLTFHKDKREMSAFVVSASKGMEKLTPTQMNGSLPGIGMRPATGGMTLMVRNGTIGDFTGFLQTLVLDRPVVDRTGLKSKFDFSVTFLPDETQFNGHSPVAKLADGVEPAPSLIEALSQQVGLKMIAEKTAVEVIAIDHVEQSSAN
ncbi:TIGR03435 family protein [Granulicella arctica]|uniref:TIGR03435 family protein n=1 Tax=Granulicella arctica TaxID=940613 RepID=UPI0021E0F822|nr:TIGR03435 family protein [Granulicella arctica]